MSLKFRCAGVLMLLAGLLTRSAQAQFAASPAALASSLPVTVPPLGLFALDTKGAVALQCPLKRTDVRADVVGTIARVTVTQRFHNSASTPIEALYTFPLPQDAAVDAMRLRAGERVIQGQIKRREEARQVYEAAKNEGQSAALLDQERPNIFTQRVANLMPGTDVNVEIAFVQPVVYRAGHYEWTFPTVVGPRFTPTGGVTTPGVRGGASEPEKTPLNTHAVADDADKITPPIAPEGQRAGHDLTMNVRLESPVPLGAISSALHPIRIARSGGNIAVVRLKEGTAIPNRDFVLRWAPRDNTLQTGLVAHADATGGTFALVLQPPTAAPREQVAPKEMVFVIDQTGSQSGLPIEKAKETMRYCIQNLNPGDTFQLLGFTTEVYPCFEKPVEATPTNIQTALDYLKPLQGGGGTDILKAADYACKLPDDPARPRIICFMTDGYVGNDMQILDYVQKNRGHARMFPFGVGNSVNRFLIDGMAKEGRGIPEFVLLNEDGQAVAKRFYDRVAKPLLLDVKVDWASLPVADVYPRVIPDVFESGPIVLTGRYQNAAASSGEVTLRGLLGGKPWSQKIRVALPATAKSGEGLPSLWARQRIEDLQTQDWMGVQSGKPNPDLKTQITNVALDFHLMSQYTSFVAVEQRVVNVGGQQKTIDVPVEMPDGVAYHGIFGEQAGVGHGVYGLLGMSQLAGLSGFGGGGAVSGSTAIGSARGYKGGGGFGGGGTGGGGMGGGIGGGALATPFRGRVTAVDTRPVTPLTAPERQDLEAALKIGTLPPNVRAAIQRRLGGGRVPDDALTLTQVEEMAPEERRLLLRRLKLSPQMQQQLDAPGSDAKPLTVQIWIDALPPKGATREEMPALTLEAKLKALGVEITATIRLGQRLLVILPAGKIDDLLALHEVRLVEPPPFH